MRVVGNNGGPPRYRYVECSLEDTPDAHCESDSCPNYKDAGSSIFVEFPRPWRFLRPQLERAMPKRRLDEARVLAPGCRGGERPSSVSHHLDDDEWHAARRTCGWSSRAAACYPTAHNVVSSGKTVSRSQGACAAGGGGSESCSVASKYAEAQRCSQPARADTPRAHACCL